MLSALGRGLRRWGAFFDISTKQKRLKDLEIITSDAEFWENPDDAQTVLKERSRLSTQVDNYEKFSQMIDECDACLELVKESEDEEFQAELLKELERTEGKLRELELSRMLSGEHDAGNAILEINAGAGGTEAQDWAEMLLRMYLRWGEKRGYKMELLSAQDGEGAGVKSAILLVSGENAFGYLRSERGVHRLVRISPFDSNARRHTSFASVSVVPEIDDAVEIDIREEELRIDTYRASGAGGQHVNKTDSAVRITHLPTGIVVACQNDRSQHKNKATCLKLLKAKLYEEEMAKKQEELAQIAGERKKIDFGSQIRSYVMHPYQMVKDLRTGSETGNVQAVMDGDLDRFIEAYLLSEYNV